MTKLDQEKWKKRWLEADTPWDLKGPHRLTPMLLKLAREQASLADGGSFFVPGCGRAHDGAYLAQHGYPTLASDIVPEAIQAASLLYKDLPNLRLAVGDAFVPAKDEVAAFNGILDRAVFCAIPPASRRDFVAACWQRLKPGGLFLSLPFSQINSGKDGPPFAIDLKTMRDTLAEHFYLVTAEEHPNPEADSRIRTEMVTVWLKK